MYDARLIAMKNDVKSISNSVTLFPDPCRIKTIIIFSSKRGPIRAKTVEIAKEWHTVKPVNKVLSIESPNLAYFYRWPLFRGWFDLLDHCRFLKHWRLFSGGPYIRRCSLGQGCLSLYMCTNFGKNAIFILFSTWATISTLDIKPILTDMLSLENPRDLL